jgi:hypothetical protein
MRAVTPTVRAPELAFTVDDVSPLEHSAVPTLAFAIRMESAGGVAVRSVTLTVQLRIAATRRRYDDREREALLEIFGQADQWGRSLRSLHWCNVTVNVGPFTGATVVDLPVACTYDLDVAATRYFDALGGGEVPVELLFSGSVFYAAPEGGLCVAPIGWDREAEWRLPAAVWRAAIERHYPDSGWLRLSRHSLDRLHRFRARRALMSWEETVEALLVAVGEPDTGTGTPAAVGEPDTGAGVPAAADEHAHATGREEDG